MNPPTLAVTCVLGVHGTTAATPPQVTFLRRSPQDPPATWTVITHCPACGPALFTLTPPASLAPRVTPLTVLYARLAAAGARVLDVAARSDQPLAVVVPLATPGGAA